MGAEETLIGRTVGGHIISKILHTFPVLWQGWELDDKGWVVEFNGGNLGIIETNHGRLFMTDTKRLESQMENYQHAIDATKKAIQIFNGE